MQKLRGRGVIAFAGCAVVSARSGATVLGADCDRDDESRAAEVAGVLIAVVTRWLQHRGNVSLSMSKRVSAGCLSVAERDEIGLPQAQDIGIREIARRGG